MWDLCLLGNLVGRISTRPREVLSHRLRDLKAPGWNRPAKYRNQKDTKNPSPEARQNALRVSSLSIQFKREKHFICVLNKTNFKKNRGRKHYFKFTYRSRVSASVLGSEKPKPPWPCTNYFKSVILVLIGKRTRYMFKRIPPAVFSQLSSCFSFNTGQ